MGDAATPILPNKTTQFGQTYPANIDAGFAVSDRIAWAFAAHEQDVGSPSPDMTVRIEAGAVYVAVTATLTEVAEQDTPLFVAPTTDPRIDRIVINNDTGVVSVIAGSEAPSPTPPVFTSGSQLPIAQVALSVGQSSIINDNITDERHLSFLGLGDAARLDLGDGIEEVGNNVTVDLDGVSIKRGASGIAVDVQHERKTVTYSGGGAVDRGKILEFDSGSALSFNMTSASTLTEGWFVYVHNSGAGDLTINPNASELIDDATTIVLKQNESTIILCDGAAFWTVGKSGAAGGLTLLATASASASATVDFDTGIDFTAHDIYVFTFANVVPSVDDRELWLRLRSGGSYRATAGDYAWGISGTVSTASTAKVANSNSDDKILISWNGASEGVGNAADESISGIVILYRPFSTARFTNVSFDTVHNAAASPLNAQMHGGGQLDGVTTAVDGLRFLFETGNISSGEFAVYGKAK